MTDALVFGKHMMELMGTLILVLTIQLSVGLGTPIAPIAIGVVLITIVYAGGPVSGAQYNPQIALAVFLRGKQTFHEMLYYWMFQIVGGILGGIIGCAIGGRCATFALGEDYNVTQAVFAEIIFSFLLSFVVLGTATNSKAADNHYYGAAIGLVVMAGAVSVGPISGGAFNPAVALGLGVANRFFNMAHVMICVAADLAGGTLAAAVFYIVAPDEF